MRKVLSGNEGLTLLELLVVMILISILIVSIMVTGNFFTSLTKGRDSRRLQDLKNMQNALEEYRTVVGAYPGTAFDCGTQLSGGSPSQDFIRFPCDPVTTSYPCMPSGSDCNSSGYKYCANTEILPTPCITNLQ